MYRKFLVKGLSREDYDVIKRYVKNVLNVKDEKFIVEASDFQIELLKELGFKVYYQINEGGKNENKES